MDMHFKLILAALVSAALLSGVETAAFPAAGAGDGKKGKADTTAVSDSAKTPQPRKKQTDLEKLMKSVVDSARGGFISLYRTDKDRIFMEYPRKYLGRRMLVGGTVSTTSDPSNVYVGYKYADPLCLRVELDDTLLVMTCPVVGASTSDPGMKTAMERNYVPVVFRRQKVQAFSRDSSSFFFDATDLVGGAVPKSSSFSEEKGTGDNKTTWFGRLKAFEDNASVAVHQNISFARSVLGIRLKTGSGSMSSTVSFLLLPDRGMRPRVQDSRIGVFSTAGPDGSARYDLTTLQDGFRPYRIAERWRIGPADTAAWLAGRLVDAAKPIVWYVDDAFPEEWKEPVRRGILAWNRAFEKIGLRNVMVAKDFPTPEEDSAFDPDNLKYSCIRYIPNATQNAMGPSWVDPESGEILNASVLVYNDVVRLINSWRFVQTAQVDERVRGRKLPQEIVDESLTYVVSHEIGHTLGLMHNMSASAAVPVDSLRSRTYTAAWGTTPSIMDYARFNYVAQPEDKGVGLTPPSLGVYDEYAIEWLYKSVPEAADMWTEAEIAGRLIDGKAGDPRYRYGAQHSSSSANNYDPSALSEDLGDDPVKAGEYGIRNLKYILPNLATWISDDEGFDHRRELYSQMAAQYNRYIGHVLAQVGGMYLHQVKDGTDGAAVEPVSGKRQKESLKWVVDQVRHASWINHEALTSRFPVHAPMSNAIASSVARTLSGTTPGNVLLSCANAGSYSVKEFYDDLFREVFRRSRRQQGLTTEEKTLQRELVTAFAKPLISARNKSLFLAEEPEEALPFADEEFCSFGESATPNPRAVNLSAIDETGSYQQLFIVKVRKLAYRCRTTAPARDKAHYEFLYRVAAAAME